MATAYAVVRAVCVVMFVRVVSVVVKVLEVVDMFVVDV